MGTPDLTLILALLAPALLIRAACVTPRAMLFRSMGFRTTALIDVAGAITGVALGVTVAQLEASYWALVVQIVTTDAVMLAMLVVAGAGIRPNRQLERLREILAFSWRRSQRVFCSTPSRGTSTTSSAGSSRAPRRSLSTALRIGYCCCRFRLLSMTVGGVLFPAFSRRAEELADIRSDLTRVARSAWWSGAGVRATSRRAMGAATRSGSRPHPACCRTGGRSAAACTTCARGERRRNKKHVTLFSA
jgi:Polysaccharide biosynthesis protein